MRPGLGIGADSDALSADLRCSCPQQPIRRASAASPARCPTFAGRFGTVKRESRALRRTPGDHSSPLAHLRRPVPNPRFAPGGNGMLRRTKIAGELPVEGRRFVHVRPRQNSHPSEPNRGRPDSKATAILPGTWLPRLVDNAPDLARGEAVSARQLAVVPPIESLPDLVVTSAAGGGDA